MKVETAEELTEALRNKYGGVIELSDDIDLTDSERKYTVNSNVTLRGNGHIIRVERPLLNANRGEVEGLTIQVSISDTKPVKVGGLTVLNTGLVENCQVYGRIESDAAVVAGVVGNNYGEVTDTEFIGQINGSESDKIIGQA
jgi:hypothetical protein